MAGKKKRDVYDFVHAVSHAAQASADLDRAATLRRSVELREREAASRKAAREHRLVLQEERQRREARRAAERRSAEHFKAEFERATWRLRVKCPNPDCGADIEWPKRKCGVCHQTREVESQLSADLVFALEHVADLVEADPDLGSKLLARKSLQNQQIRSYLDRRRAWMREWLDAKGDEYLQEANRLDEKSQVFKDAFQARVHELDGILDEAANCLGTICEALDDASSAIDRRFSALVGYSVAVLVFFLGFLGGMSCSGWEFDLGSMAFALFIGVVVAFVGGAFASGIGGAMAPAAQQAQLDRDAALAVERIATRWTFRPQARPVRRLAGAVADIAHRRQVSREQFRECEAAFDALELERHQLHATSRQEELRARADAEREDALLRAHENCVDEWLAEQLEPDVEGRREALPGDSGAEERPAEFMLEAVIERCVDVMPSEPELAYEEAEEEDASADSDVSGDGEPYVWIHVGGRIELWVWLDEWSSESIDIVVGLYSENEVRDKKFRQLRRALEDAYQSELAEGWNLERPEWKTLAYEARRTVLVSELTSDAVIEDVAEAVTALGERIRSEFDV